MAIYEFTCPECGTFELVRPMARAADPADCPTCRAAARRVYSPPGLALVAAPVRRALDYEEKSAHEPDVVMQKRGRPLPHRHARAPSWVVSH